MSAADDKRRMPFELFAEADALDAPLDERLALYEATTRDVLPEVHAVYDRLVARLESASAISGVPGAGDELPDFSLPDQESRIVNLSELVKRGPVVVSINRGHWCPYCRLELRALASAALRVREAGADIVSIVPETAEHSARLRREHSLPFRLLSDVDLGYALSLGIVFWLGEELIDLYRKMGLDLPRFARTEGWFLPVPATFVVGPERRILASFVNPDFRKRMAIEPIEAALRAS